MLLPLQMFSVGPELLLCPQLETDVPAYIYITCEKRPALTFRPC